MTTFALLHTLEELGRWVFASYAPMSGIVGS
jgi:hypothetical protein